MFKNLLVYPLKTKILNKLVPKQFLLLLVIHLYNLISGRFAAASGYVRILFGQILGGKVGTMLQVYGRLVRMGQPGLNETFSKQPEAIL